MAERCGENGTLRMDWVDTVGEWLADDRALPELEWLALEWCRRGVRHVLWSGMGGSGITDPGSCRACPRRLRPDPASLRRHTDSAHALGSDGEAALFRVQRVPAALNLGGTR
jgi:hypothetical protein